MPTSILTDFQHPEREISLTKAISFTVSHIELHDFRSNQVGVLMQALLALLVKLAPSLNFGVLSQIQLAEETVYLS